MYMCKVTVAAVLVTAGLLQAGLAQADGAGVFRANCVSCHGKDGQGTKGLAPALKGDAFVTGDAAAVLATVKDGRSGDQKKYKDLPIAMPAWGGKLSDADIQAVVDYIRGDLQKQ